MSPAVASVLLRASLQVGSDTGGPGDSAGASVEGEATLGLRFVRVDGSRAQYDEDVNLDEGLYLRSARLRISGLEDGPLELIEVEASGLGDPWSSLGIEALGGPWRTRAGFHRQRYVGNAQADQHAFDIERERTRLDVEYRSPNSETHSALGFELLQRDGLYVGSRSINLGFVEGFPVRRRESTRAVNADFGSRSHGWSLDMGLGLETLDADDRRTFTLPAPGFPGEEFSEDYASEIRGLGQHGELRLGRELSEWTRLDLGMGWHATALDGDEVSIEDAFFFDPGLPFVRSTTADLELAEREFEGKAELSHSLSEVTQVSLAYERRQDRGNGDVARLVQQDEFTGEPPSVSAFLDESEHESTLDLLRIDLSTEFPSARLDLDLEWGREEMEMLQVGDGVIVRSIDDSLREFGGEVGASFALPDEFSLDLGLGHHLRPTETPEAGVAFAFEDDRETFARMACRRRSALRSYGGEVRFQHRTSEAFSSSEADVARGSLDYTGALDARTHVEAILSLAVHRLDSEATFLFFDPSIGVEAVPAAVHFDAHDIGLSGSLTREIWELHPRLEWGVSFARGDAEFDYLTGSAALPWVLHGGFEVGLEVRGLRFDGSMLLEDSDYRALIVDLYLRRAFPSRPL